MKKNLPNAVTLLNLLFGCMALAAVFRGDVPAVALWIVAAAVADFLDGALARALRVHSLLGAQLDSLADAVSFGVVPGAIFYYLLAGTAAGEGMYIAAVPGFLVSAFAALRLGRFNLDTRQTEHFIGLPTPAATLFALGWLLIVHTDALGWGAALGMPVIIYAGIVGLCWLMNAELPMFSLKFKSLAWAGNEIRYIFAAAAILMLFLFKAAAPTLIIAAYILVSLVQYWFTTKRHL